MDGVRHEYHCSDGRRWQVETVYRSKEEAVAAAHRLGEMLGCHNIRVVDDAKKIGPIDLAPGDNTITAYTSDAYPIPYRCYYTDELVKDCNPADLPSDAHIDWHRRVEYMRRGLPTKGEVMENESVVPDPEQYWDLTERINSNAYSDFEGFADPKQVLPLLANPDVACTLEIWSDANHQSHELLHDLLLHFAYENIDQGDHEITPEEACTFINTVAWLLGSRYWMKVKDEELQSDDNA